METGSRYFFRMPGEYLPPLHLIILLDDAMQELRMFKVFRVDDVDFTNHAQVFYRQNCQSALFYFFQTTLSLI